MRLKFQRFWVKKPRHSENIFAKKRYTLIWLISDDSISKLRSTVMQKTFSQKKGIP